MNDQSNLYAYYINTNLYIKDFLNPLSFASYISSFKVQDQNIDPCGKIDTFYFTPIFKVKLSLYSGKIINLSSNCVQYFKCTKYASEKRKYEYHYIENLYMLNENPTEYGWCFKPEFYSRIKANSQVTSEYDGNCLVITVYLPHKVSFQKFMSYMMTPRTYEEYMPKLKQVLIKELKRKREEDYSIYTNLIKNTEEKEKWI